MGEPNDWNGDLGSNHRVLTLGAEENLEQHHPIDVSNKVINVLIDVMLLE